MIRSQLVISRFNEDITWLDQWKNTFDVLIYNKGEKIKDNNGFEIINLSNFGREAHTYLNHIVENYDNLYDVTVFLQAKIDDLENWVFHDLNQYITYALNNGYGANSMGVIRKDQWKIDFLKDPKYRVEIENGRFRLSDISLSDYVEKYFGHIPESSPISLKGCFSVRKDLILSKPKNFYKDLLDSIPQHHSPEEAHFLERMWAYMFLAKIDY